ncbi:enoyl-CoA hydratase/isomerase family protein [Ramlibacter sp.]|uniref:enoyl-CoA hydratase/isomerase family protein n=1 Tax=Ramlibacter sp. TaxID=1917967 RepID=UPI003D11ED4B
MPEAGFRFLRYEVRGKVAVITYDHQEVRNAWDVAMYREIEQAVARANEDAAVGAIVFTHAGPVYCAGTNLKAKAAAPRLDAAGRPETIGSVSMAQDTGWIHLLARSKPSIAAVQGAAIGLGVTQLLPMDVRMGSTASTYSFPFLSLGFMPELGSTALLARLVGNGRARDLILSAATIDADEALRIGLLTRVSPPETLLDDAVALGERIAGFGALQVRLTRDLLAANAAEADANAFLARERDAFAALRQTLKAERAR